MKYLIVYLCMFCVGFGNLTDNEIAWETNYERALKSAKKNNKNVLVYFTGSDWCGPCKMLKKDLFATEEFKELSKSYTLLYIDIPRNQDLLTPQQMKHNKTLLKSLNKKGVFPLFLALDEKGKILDEYSGYAMNGNVSYHLNFLKKNK